MTKNKDIGLPCLKLGMKRTEKPSLVSIGGASLVPAAAVIPVPRSYMKVLALTRLVIGFLLRTVVRTVLKWMRWRSGVHVSGCLEEFVVSVYNIYFA